MALDVRPCGLEVAEGRFGLREVQHHQSARRVVHIHQQRAGRRPFLEPSMVAAVDLDQFAQTRPPCPRLVDLRRTLPTRNPEPGVRHQLPDRFLGQPNAVTLPELLAGQRRPEIGVAIADDRQRPVGGSWIQATVAGLRSMSRHQARRTVLTQPGDQPPNLPCRQLQPFGRTPWLELAVGYVLNDLEPVQLAHRHRDPLRCSHRSLRRRTPGGRTAYAARKADISM